MQLLDIETLAVELLENFPALSQWEIKIRNTSKAAGRCKYETRQIILSGIILPLMSEDDIRNTILHEIAHALTPGHGHNLYWRQTAIKIGCSGDRCYSLKSLDAANFG